MSLSKLAKKTAQTAKNIGETLRAAFRGKITLVVSSEPIQRVQLSGLAEKPCKTLNICRNTALPAIRPTAAKR